MTGIVQNYVAMQREMQGSRFRVERPPRSVYPAEAERDYRRYLLALVTKVKAEIDEELVPLVPALVRAGTGRADATRYNLEDIEGTLGTVTGDIQARVNNRYLRDLEERVETYRSATSVKVMEDLRRQIRAMIALDAFPQAGQAERIQLEAYLRQNVKLIKSLTGDYVDQVEDVVRRGVQAGDRPTVIQDTILKRFDVTKSRAELIAVDQIGKLRGNLTRVRQTSLGIDRYIWRTSRDERVRESHLVKEGKVYSWDDPPADTGHPGQDYRCRCTAEPYIEGEPPPAENRQEVIAEVRAKRERLRGELRAKAEARRARVVAKRQRELAKRGPFKPSRSAARPANPKQAELFDAVDAWVHGSRSRSAVVMKRAAKSAFQLSGVDYTRRAYAISQADVTGAVPAIRRMYSQTQRELSRRGVKTMRLYRGIKAKYTTGGALESWTTDPDVARRFAGRGGTVVVDDVPATKILNGVDMEHWHNGRFGNQSEWIVME